MSCACRSPPARDWVYESGRSDSALWILRQYAGRDEVADAANGRDGAVRAGHPCETSGLTEPMLAGKAQTGAGCKSAEERRTVPAAKQNPFHAPHIVVADRHVKRSTVTTSVAAQALAAISEDCHYASGRKAVGWTVPATKKRQGPIYALIPFSGV